jgi:hypothetical protein
LSNGGSASGTAIEAGGLLQEHGGTAIDTTVSGTFTMSSGVASGTVVAAQGSVSDGFGGALDDTTVLSGGFVLTSGALDDITIQGGGVVDAAYSTVSGVTIETGAVMSVDNGGALSGADVRSGGALVLAYGYGYPAQVSDVHLHVGATVDFADMYYYSSSTIASLNAHDVLTVQDSLQDREQIGLTGNYTGDTFLLSSDGNYGTLVTLSVATSASFISPGGLSATDDVWGDDWRSLPAGAGGTQAARPSYTTMSHTAPRPVFADLDDRLGGHDAAATHAIVAWHPA